MPVIRIATAAKADLLRAARDVLNLPVDGSETVDQLRAVIAAVHEDKTIDIPDERPTMPEGARPVAQPGSVVVAGRTVPVDSKGRVWISIPADETTTDPNVAVGVNGKTMLIPRGEPVPIPISYYEVLLNSVRRIPIVNRDNEIMGWRESPAYPFSVHPPAA